MEAQKDIVMTEDEKGANSIDNNGKRPAVDSSGDGTSEGPPPQQISKTDSSGDGTSENPLAQPTAKIDSSGDGISPADGTSEGPPPEKVWSKNQLKKQRRLERVYEVKKRRKEQDKEARRAKAVAQGRDLEAEQKLLEARTLAGESKKKRQATWETIYQPLAEQSFQVSLDCAYESSMTAKEINSLASQIRYCYSNNRRNFHPCLLSATSLDGATMKHLENVQGYEEWKHRAFTFTTQPLEEYYKSDLANIVYLTSDSKNTLQHLDDSKIYVIGGIVDRNRLQKAALDRAESLGVATAKLPLDEHLKAMKTTRVLTCNHVFDILLKYREHGRDWKKALQEVLPERKGAIMEESEKIEKIDAPEAETRKDDSKSTCTAT
jgi:tRNA (guanine9-N1)-methyltransferase